MAAIKVLLLVVLACVGGVRAEYKLRLLDTEYLPKSYTPTEEFEYNSGAAEQSAVDPNQPIIYVCGLNYIHVVNISDPKSLSRPYHVEVGAENDGEVTDVEACGSLVAVSYDNFVDPLDGKVFVYNTYTASADTPMELLHTISVGSMPDMVKFTSDCSKLIVAVEGELRVVAGEAVDPEGQVAIITFRPQPQEPLVDIADFKKFNDLEEDYVARGVRRVYSGQGTNQSTTFSQDLEPEYIAINKDNSRAYVVLQEANAVAVVDINAAEVLELYSFGHQWFNSSSLDASDKDGGINLQPWDIYGMPQPDGAAFIELDGASYLITANEGGAKEYDTSDGLSFDWEEEQRGGKFDEDDFAADVPSSFISSVLLNTELGRLVFSEVDGLNADDKYEKLFCYGSRSFSMYRVTDFSRAYDSGDEMESIVAEKFPSIFNSNSKSEDSTPEEAMDARSDNSGPAPSTIEYGTTANGDKLVFVGLERPGFVMIYSLTSNNGTPELTFHSISYGGGFGKTYEELYEDRVARDLAPEDIRFIPASRGIGGYDLLAVTGAYSGTLSLYEVHDDDAVTTTPSASSSPSLLPVHGLVVLVLFCGKLGLSEDVMSWF